MDYFVNKCQKIGVSLSAGQTEAFSTYLNELKIWNDKFNLTAIRTDEEIMLKHFVDSLSVLQALPAGPCTLIDIGTGAGFPGIPLKIVRPDLRLTLVDAELKKVTFLKHMISTLHLEHTEALHERAEILGQSPECRERFDIVTNRAVAELSVIAEYSLPLLTVGGTWIAQKSADSEFTNSALKSIELLGGTFEKSIPVTIDDLSPRRLLVVKKISPTPLQFPRRPGMQTKKPL